MELQELVNIWKHQDEQLENNLQVNHRLLKEASIQKVRSFLAEFKASSIIEIVFDSLFLMVLMPFIATHIGAADSLKFLLPAFVLAIYMIAGLTFNIYKLVLLSRINAQTPVVQTQKIIGQLKLYNLREKNALYIGIPIFAPAFLIVVAKALFDYDLYVHSDWLLSFTAGSFVVALIVVWLLKRYPDKNMEQASRFMEEVSAFEKES